MKARYPTHLSISVIERGPEDEDQSRIKLPFGFARALVEDEREHASGVILPPGVRV